MLKPDTISPAQPPASGRPETSAAAAPPPASRSPRAASLVSASSVPRVKWLAGIIAVLVLCFGGPLYSWARFALHSDLYSHVLLVPFITLYLIWLKRSKLDLESAADRRLALIPFLGGAALLVV